MYVGIDFRQYMQIYKRVMALELVRISYRINILIITEGNLIKICIWINIDKLWVGIVYASIGADL